MYNSQTTCAQDGRPASELPKDFLHILKLLRGPAEMVLQVQD